MALGAGDAVAAADRRPKRVTACVDEWGSSAAATRLVVEIVGPPAPEQRIPLLTECREHDEIDMGIGERLRRRPRKTSSQPWITSAALLKAASGMPGSAQYRCTHPGWCRSNETPRAVRSCPALPATRESAPGKSGQQGRGGSEAPRPSEPTFGYWDRACSSRKAGRVRASDVIGIVVVDDPPRKGAGHRNATPRPRAPSARWA